MNRGTQGGSKTALLYDVGFEQIIGGWGRKKPTRDRR